MKLSTLALALLVMPACGKKGGSGGGDRGTGLTPDAAAVNALVPAPLKDKIVFERQDVATELGHSKTTYTLAMPKGWKRGDMSMFADFEAPRELGYRTGIKVSENCNGSCEPKDWAKVADEYVAPFLKGKVLKDVKGKTNRLVIAETSGSGVESTEVVFAWWSEGASESYFCSASLAPEVKDAVHAFEKACQAVGVVVADTK